MSNQIKRPYPDNWPWGTPHKHPDGDTPPPFEGFNPEYPEEGSVISNLAYSIREAKRALNSVVSVPAVFSCDVEDGDIVIPLPCGDSCDVNCDELLKTLRDLGQIPDAIWVPAFRTSIDSQVSILSAVDPTTYDPPFYGVAYTGIKRVMVGPVVVHPRFKFHTGDKIYAGSDGDLTTTANEHMVGVCLAPGAIFLSQYASVLREAMKDLYDEATQDAEDNTIEKIEQEGLQGDNIKVTTDGATTERPLELHLGDIVNVKDFGAKGDGVTNDTNAFNAAIAHMQELGSNVCLFIPPGDYLVTELPNVPCYGPGSIKYNSYTYSPFELLFKLNGAIQKDTNGRFKVDFTKMSEADLAALIKQLLPSTGGGLTTDEDGKLVVDFTQMSEEELREMIEALLPDTGGGLTTDEDGKLVLDFSQLTPTQKEDLISQIVQEGGGLSVDEEGKIYVDFDSMPTDKFEAMLKSIRVPIWLTANKTFYVNGTTGSDTLDAGRGESSSKPFATIQACVNYVCDNYNVSSYKAIISVAPGDYNESLNLASYSGTTGYIILAGSGEGVNISADNDYAIRVSQKTWDLQKLNITLNLTDALASSTATKVTGCIIATNNSVAYIRGCNISVVDNVTSPDSINRTVTLAIVDSSQGTIRFPSTAIGKNAFTAPSTKPSYITGNIYCIRGVDSSNIICSVSNNTQDDVTTEVSGAFTNFILLNNASFTRQASGTYKYIFVDKTESSVTGKRYSIINGGSCITAGGGANYFPGNEAGTVDASTYSFYN